MKRLVYYLIFLLALVMMLLCSTACRSPKTVTYSQATKDSLTLSIKDSTAQRFSFTFDSLELWLPALQPTPLACSEVPSFRSSEYSSSAQPSSEFPKFFLHDATKALRDNRTSEFPYHLVIYGGKLQSDKTRAMSHDSTLTHSSTQSHHSEFPKFRISVIPYGIALAIAILLLFLKQKSKALS